MQNILFFSSIYGKFSRIDHMLGHRTSLHKFKKTEILTSIFANHNGIKLEMNYKNKTEKCTSMWKLNNVLLHNERVNNKVKEVIKRYLDENKTNENENSITPNPWDAAKAVLRRK